MDERLARILLSALARATRELGIIPPLLAAHADEKERDALREPVATAIYQIMSEIMDPLYERFPQLRTEFEANVEEYGFFC